MLNACIRLPQLELLKQVNGDHRVDSQAKNWRREEEKGGERRREEGERSTQWSLMNDYDLLFCLRRDSSKVQNYLKILKCRIVPGNDC
ncbi:hypothetical protein CRUP_033741 [Coryphaenoides rupestris]|nr:hypothetical protein CRUP_033741 [Coryphaenoides rupestris]